MSQAASTAVADSSASYTSGDAVSGNAQSKWITYAVIGAVVLLAYLFFNRRKK